MFAGTRVDVTYEEALARAQAFSPGVVVCDSCDHVGPTAAAAVGAARATHGIAGALPPPFVAAMDHRWAGQLRARDLRARPRLGYVNPYPDLLRDAGEFTPPDRIPVLFTAFDRSGASNEPPQFDDHSLPRVLLTLGSSVAEPHLAATIAGSLADVTVNVLVTDDAPADRAASPRIRHIGFVPLARLLRDVNRVVPAGGTALC